MLVYTFDRTFDGLLTAVFDAFALHQQPEELVAEGDVLPMFCDEVHQVATASDKSGRVWRGLEKQLKRETLHLIAVSWLSEARELYTPLFHYIYKVFQLKADISTNFSDADVLYVTNTARRVMHEQHRMKQFVRFQKAKDGTYLGVVSPDNDVLPLIIDHFADRFRDQQWLLFDARRKYGYYHAAERTADMVSFSPPSEGPGEVISSEGSGEVIPSEGLGDGGHSPLLSEGLGEAFRITFENADALPFDLQTGKLSDELLSENDQLFQELWRTYFKAICIRERLNPKKQLNDMPRRYWRYLTEKQ
ncbi:MAG: TIGR03915 family putative DNA repair protein [Prevotella sp.]|nr:TIGR03915 family putative DNA repair protein [Prevotella sp.]